MNRQTKVESLVVIMTKTLTALKPTATATELLALETKIRAKYELNSPLVDIICTHCGNMAELEEHQGTLMCADCVEIEQ